MSGAAPVRIFDAMAHGLDVAGADLREEIRRRLDQHVDLAGDEVLQRRPVAAIRHELSLRAGLLLEREAGEMAGAADARECRSSPCPDWP